MAAATRASAATWQVGARTRAGHLRAVGSGQCHQFRVGVAGSLRSHRARPLRCSARSRARSRGATVGLDLLGARVLVEEALGIELEERESGYYAGNYFCLRTGGTRPLMLYSNFDESS